MALPHHIHKRRPQHKHNGHCAHTYHRHSNSFIKWVHLKHHCSTTLSLLRHAHRPLTYNQTDQLWPPPDTANCTTLLLLSGPASAALLSRLSDASFPWAAPATLWLCNNCILTVCFATVTELQHCQACQLWQLVCLCCSAHQGNPAQHQ